MRILKQTFKIFLATTKIGYKMFSSFTINYPR